MVAGGPPWPASCPPDTNVAASPGVIDGGGIAPFARVGDADRGIDEARSLGVTDGGGIAPFARVGEADSGIDEARAPSDAGELPPSSESGWPQPLPPAIGLHAGVGSPGAQSVMGGEVVLSLWGL